MKVLTGVGRVTDSVEGVGRATDSVEGRASDSVEWAGPLTVLSGQGL